jgi:hypothetical protein
MIMFLMIVFIIDEFNTIFCLIIVIIQNIILIDYFIFYCFIMITEAISKVKTFNFNVIYLFYF